MFTNKLDDFISLILEIRINFSLFYPNLNQLILHSSQTNLSQY